MEASSGHVLPAATAAKSLQSCPTLCDPIDSSPPGSHVSRILQARTLEWVAISFSSAWKWKVKVKSLSHVRLLATAWTAAYQAPPAMGVSRQEYRSAVPLGIKSGTIRTGVYDREVSVHALGCCICCLDRNLYILNWSFQDFILKSRKSQCKQVLHFAHRFLIGFVYIVNFLMLWMMLFMENHFPVSLWGYGISHSVVSWFMLYIYDIIFWKRWEYQTTWSASWEICMQIRKQQ